MLRLALNILILFMLIRLMQPLFQGAKKFLRRFLAPESTGGPPPDKKVEYSDLTPYEIEDAEYEELRGKGE